MIKIENTVTPSPEQWRAVVMGARNPKNSYAKSDSNWETGELGGADLNLLSRLTVAGPEHAKFNRMLPVWFDLSAPLYILAELDTYKVGTVRNSCSFMHKGVAKPFEFSDFGRPDDGTDVWWFHTVLHLNTLRDRYLETKDETVFQEIRKCLPSGYMQKATFFMNYGVLRNIYFQRRNHRLPEWHDFCAWIETLPYAAELITKEKTNE